MYSKTAALSALALGGSSVYAAQNSRTYGIGYFWSSPLVEARMDPIISPGEISAHVHTVVGGNGFGISMDENAAADASCTQSRVNGDKSNYWAPALYHQNANGSFTKVEVDYVKAYYFFDPTDDEIVPFPKGFRMISGNPFTRSPTHLPYADNIDPNAGPVQPISFTCPQSGDSNAWNSTLSTATGQGPTLPDQKCDGLYSPLRYNVHFPSCIDTSLPYTQYQNNSVWASSAGASAAGKTNCPKGYTHVPHLFLEIYWNTMAFTDWTVGQGTQPFVLAQGDPTGYGLHADFVSGWDTDVLSSLIATCNAGGHGDGLDSCPNVAAYSGSPTSCTVASANPSEVVSGTLDALPGCNPIQPGPETAVPCDCSSGKPVCNGSVTSNSTVPSTGSGNGTETGTGTSSAASESAGAGSGTGSGSGSAPASSPSSSAGASSGSTSKEAGSGSSKSGTSSSSSSGDGSDDGDDGDDGDDDTCAPEEPQNTTETKKREEEAMVRRHARHLNVHKRGVDRFLF